MSVRPCQILCLVLHCTAVPCTAHNTTAISNDVLNTTALNALQYNFTISITIADKTIYFVSVLGPEKGYTIKYNPLPEGVPESNAQGNS